jgi:hypothetical protein
MPAATLPGTFKQKVVEIAQVRVHFQHGLGASLLGFCRDT